LNFRKISTVNKIVKIALTGSIGMGKTSTLKTLESMGFPVFDADLEVHRLLSVDNSVINFLKQHFSKAFVHGVLDRKRLRDQAFSENKIGLLEAQLHPRVKIALDAFFAKCVSEGHSVVIADMPLLFEAGFEQYFDYVLVVYCSKELQLQRLKERGLPDSLIVSILKRQYTTRRKRLLGDFSLQTGASEAHIKRRLLTFLSSIGVVCAK